MCTMDTYLDYHEMDDDIDEGVFDEQDGFTNC